MIRFEQDPDIRWVLINRKSGFIMRGLDRDTIIHTIHPNLPPSVVKKTVELMIQRTDFYETSDWIVKESKR